MREKRRAQGLEVGRSSTGSSDPSSDFEGGCAIAPRAWRSIELSLQASLARRECVASDDRPRDRARHRAAGDRPAGGSDRPRRQHPNIASILLTPCVYELLDVQVS